MPPVYDPQKVADAIVGAAVRPRRTVIVGGAGQVLMRLHRHFPRLVEAALRRTAFRPQRSRQPKSEDAHYNLFAATGNDTRVRGREGETARALERRRSRRRQGAIAASLMGIGALAWLRAWRGSHA